MAFLSSLFGLGQFTLSFPAESRRASASPGTSAQSRSRPRRPLFVRIDNIWKDSRPLWLTQGEGQPECCACLTGVFEMGDLFNPVLEE